MRNKIIFSILAISVLIPSGILAQSSSINTFNPYTFYGLGDIETPGTAMNRAMGGVGIAYRSPVDINFSNPAAYSAISPKSFLFNIGLSGKNSYIKTSEKSSAHNNFNISDIAVQFPLYKGIGFSVSVAPISSVGYKTKFRETDPDIVANLGHVMYDYSGEGGISQFKGGIGAQIFKGFSLGADFIYYHGNISRYSSVSVTPTTSSESFNNVYVNANEEISKVLFGLGLQYNIIQNSNRMLTFGATFQPKAVISNKISKQISVSGSSDSIMYRANRTDLTVPQRIGAGFFYRTNQLGVGVDYTYQDWKDAFEIPAVDGFSLTKTQTFSIGGQYTPNRIDIRNRFNRWTYRAGFRYTDLYLMKDGHKTNDMAITFGVGIPVRISSMSEISVGVELGKRGKTDFGLVQDKYFKISLGFSLFGEDYWFIKPKFD